MQEFVTTTTIFLSKTPLNESICAFNDLLREEQIKRNAHILCLPFEIIFLIMYIAEGNTINVHRNIYKYLSILGKDQIHMLKEQSKMLSGRWLKLKEICRSLIEININEEFPLVILVQTDTPAPPHTGTNIGRHILCILEENHQSVFKKQDKSSYKFNICEHAEIFDQDMTVSAHKCALVVKHRQNPFGGVEEFVSIQTSKVHKIWWVQNTTDNISCILAN